MKEFIWEDREGVERGRFATYSELAKALHERSKETVEGDRVLFQAANGDTVYFVHAKNKRGIKAAWLAYAPRIED